MSHLIFVIFLCESFCFCCVFYFLYFLIWNWYLISGGHRRRPPPITISISYPKNTHYVVLGSWREGRRGSTQASQLGMAIRIGQFLMCFLTFWRGGFSDLTFSTEIYWDTSQTWCFLQFWAGGRWASIWASQQRMALGMGPYLTVFDRFHNGGFSNLTFSTGIYADASQTQRFPLVLTRREAGKHPCIAVPYTTGGSKFSNPS